MAKQPIHDHFHAPGLRAELGESGNRIWFQVELQPGEHLDTNAVRLEVLYQPRNEHGLPRGSACVIFQDVWKLNTEASSLSRTIFGWLPYGITPDNARLCHYRVTPVKIEAADHPDPTPTPADS